jgi:hypothetical protein
MFAMTNCEPLRYVINTVVEVNIEFRLKTSFVLTSELLECFHGWNTTLVVRILLGVRFEKRADLREKHINGNCHKTS